jgi:hypothetical protein
MQYHQCTLGNTCRLVPPITPYAHYHSCPLHLRRITAQLRHVAVRCQRRRHKPVAQQAAVLLPHEGGQVTVALIGNSSREAVTTFVVDYCGGAKQRVRVERVPEVVAVAVEEASGQRERVS